MIAPRYLAAACWLLLAMGGTPARAADPVEATEKPADTPRIQLPPMIAESANAPRWFYVEAGGTEYLSRCSERVTRDFVTAQLRMNQLLRVLVPDSFLVKMDVPAVVILYNQALKQAADEAVARDIEKQREAVPPKGAANLSAPPAAPLEQTVQFLPNLRLDDRDMHGLFAYLDEQSFDGERMTLMAPYVQMTLERRTPMLPPWLIEAVVGVYRRARFSVEPITMRQIVWVTPAETAGLIKDPDRPRALLTAEEMFAADTLAGGRSPKYLQTWRDQVALFFRWALDPQNPDAREAFWRFVARAAEEPATETMFEECFGFGYSDLRDRLSDYLVVAVKEPMRVEPGKLLPLPKITVEQAAPDQVARLRGEWERLEIGYVRTRHPEYAKRYIDQARLTLRRAYDQGDRDPRLLAALGLCEVDAGSDATARPYLEKAAATEVVRPRLYHELARMNFAELVREQPPTRTFPAEAMTRVFAHLRSAARQSPPLPEAYMLFADAWLRCTEPPPAGDLQTLVNGTKLFAWRPAYAFRVALLQAKLGRRDDAAKLLAGAIEYVPDEPTRARFAEFRAKLMASRP